MKLVLNCDDSYDYVTYQSKKTHIDHWKSWIVAERIMVDIYLYIFVYINMYICIHIYIFIFIYICICKSHKFTSC
jgi:hypothetical protein